MEFSTFAADSHQTPNVPGIRRFWKIRRKAFTAIWPLLADTDTGEITVDPLTKLPSYFEPAEYVVPQNTKDGTFAGQPELGYDNYAHTFGYEMAGISKAIMAEIMKNRNADSVYIVQDTDEQLWVFGTSSRGLVETITGGFGKLGSDKRGLSITATADGFMWPPLQLSSDVAEAFMARSWGYGPLYGELAGAGSPWDEEVVNAIEFTDAYGVAIANTAWQVNDEVLLVRANEATYPAQHTPKSMKDGWLEGVIVAITGNSIEIEAVSFSRDLGYVDFWTLQKPRTVYSGLTIGSAPSNGYTGALAYTLASGTLPFVAGDKIFVYLSNGSGTTSSIKAIFVSQVGTTVNVTAVSTEVGSSIGGPPATTGWHIMLDTII